MATVNFLYRSTKDNAPLNARLLFRHDDNDYTKGAKTELLIYSHEELIKNQTLNGRYYWNKLHNKINTKDIDLENKQTEVNTELNKIKNFILKTFKSAKINEVISDTNWLKNCLNDYYRPETGVVQLSNELLKYFDFYIEEKKTSLANQTLKNYTVIKNLLDRYEKNIGSKVLIENVDSKFKVDFEKYCLDEGYAVNTISRAIHSVKTICLHARYNGLETSYQLEKLKLKEVKVPNIYLSIKDLEKIENTNFESDHLKNAKDWLITSCYVGQRVSDLMKFTKKQIREEAGKFLIEFTQKKTKKIMTVPLHPKVIEILNKRNGNFPRPISEQKYNDYIKTICKKSGIDEKVKGSKKVETVEGSKKYRKQVGVYDKWELVSSHIGRRSFATNFYGQIPTSYLIYVTGHSTEQMFLSYIGKSNKDLAMEIVNYFRKMNIEKRIDKFLRIISDPRNISPDEFAEYYPKIGEKYNLKGLDKSAIEKHFREIQKFKIQENWEGYINLKAELYLLFERFGEQTKEDKEIILNYFILKARELRLKTQSFVTEKILSREEYYNLLGAYTVFYNSLISLVLNEFRTLIAEHENITSHLIKKQNLENKVKFKIGLLYAKGKLEKYIHHEAIHPDWSAPKIEKEINIPKSREYILGTLNGYSMTSSNHSKNVFNSKKYLDAIFKYCKENNIEVIEDFKKKYNLLHFNKA